MAAPLRVPPARVLISWGLLLILSLLWIRSYWRTDTLLLFVPGDRVQGVTSARGVILVAVSNVAVGREWAWSADHVAFENEADDPGFDKSAAVLIGVDETIVKPKFLGFGAVFPAQNQLLIQRTRAAVILVPHWFILGLIAIFPVRAALRRRRMARWKREGRCVQCGYDLRASPQRCPECGQVATAE
jgi:hypothetical protein